MSEKKVEYVQYIVVTKNKKGKYVMDLHNDETIDHLSINMNASVISEELKPFDNDLEFAFAFKRAFVNLRDKMEENDVFVSMEKDLGMLSKKNYKLADLVDYFTQLFQQKGQELYIRVSRDCVTILLSNKSKVLETYVGKEKTVVDALIAFMLRIRYPMNQRVLEPSEPII